ncbi:unnamed protein product [Phytophthora lilii]|uniref:Unnamed protein product n=1 Tax=Phytophthora lilii TaxID=2077276 RepID=A0A9W6WXD9_9STRA|nr:unnamed protein product [Phytophthora lilii]
MQDYYRGLQRAEEQREAATPALPTVHNGFDFESTSSDDDDNFFSGEEVDMSLEEGPVGDNDAMKLWDDMVIVRSFKKVRY